MSSYDWETYAPPSTNGAGGLGFIGMQATKDSASSPIGQLAQRQREQGWASMYRPKTLRVPFKCILFSRFQLERA